MNTGQMRSLVVRDDVEGKVCSRCGEWKPLEAYSRKLRFVHSQCKVCQKHIYDSSPKPDKRAYYAAYRQSHREEIKAYRENNRGRSRDYAKQYQRQRSERYPDGYREAKRRWASHNKQKISEANRRWREQNPEKALLKDHRRRARERLAPGIFTRAEWQLLKQSCGSMCLCCGLSEKEAKLVPDHVIPLAKGGSNCIENIQPLCESCNKRKGVRTTDYRTFSRTEY